MSENARVVAAENGVRILCIADAHGALRQINELVEKHKADVVVHTGSFGFFDSDSADSMPSDDLAIAANRSLVVTGGEYQNMDEEHLRESVGSQLSELPLFLAGAQKFNVPVYTIWGSCEDVVVVEKFRTGVYEVPHLHVVDEVNAPLIPNTTIRLLGLPGLFQKSQLFNIGDGKTVAGTCGSMWVGIWQVGELLHTFKETYDPREVRLFLSSTNPLQNPLLNYLALVLRCDLTVSGGSSSEDVSSFSDLVVYESFQPFARSLKLKKSEMFSFWSQIKTQFLELTEEATEQRELVLSAINLITSRDHDLPPQKILAQGLNNKWNFNLCNVSKGALVLAAGETGIVSENGTNSFNFERRLTEPVVDPTQDIDLESEASTVAEENASEADTADADAKLEKARAKREKLDKKEKLKALKKEKARLTKQDEAAQERQEQGDENTSEDLPHHHIPKGPSNASFAENEGATKSKRQLGKEKAKPRREKDRPKSDEEPVDRRPGLWFKNGDRSPEEVLGFLAEEDRKSNPRVEIRSSVKANGLKSKVALVFFDTREQASGAYERVDKDSAGTVSIYLPEQLTPRKFMRKTRKW